MTYQCDWSLEIPVTVGGRVVGYCPDVDCVLALDERGDLFKVGFREFARPTDALVWMHSGAIFGIANLALVNNRAHIMELCEIPSNVRHPPAEQPEYSGKEYKPAMRISYLAPTGAREGRARESSRVSLRGVKPGP